jgi:hypothetical protein
MSAVGKTARNEQRRLSAATINAVGLAFGAVGVIQPVILGEFTSEAIAKLAICALIAYVFHNWAVRELAALED